MSTVFSLLYLIYAAGNANQLEIFIYSSSFVDFFIFTIGSAYFVAGYIPSPSLSFPSLASPLLSLLTPPSSPRSSPALP
jgi:hypothetical protein